MKLGRGKARPDGQARAERAEGKEGCHMTRLRGEEIEMEVGEG